MKRVVVIFTTVLILALLYFFIDARTTDFFPRCPFNSLTHLYCPGCGSQRAVSALLHGNFLQALCFNFLLVVSLPFVLYSAAVHFINAFYRKKFQQKLFYSPVFVKAVLAVVIIFWICRNIPVYPFSILAPHS